MPIRPDVPTVTVLGVPIARLTVRDARREVARLLADKGPSVLVYVNAHSLNLTRHDTAYRDAVIDADLVLNDGAGLALAARLQGNPFPANLNGTDFTPEVLRISANAGLPVYLLGGKPGVTERAARELTRSIPGLRIVGCRGGYFSASEEEEIAAEVSSSGAEVLIVAMGNPRQELYLSRHVDMTGARLGIGVGAFLDFAAKRVRRAPRWMRRLRIEWVYRFVLEPHRLWRRYLLGNGLFVLRVLGEQLRRKHRWVPGRLRHG